MDCRDIERAIGDHHRVDPLHLSPEAMQHVAGCQSCRDLVALFASPDPVSPVPPSLVRELEQRIAQDLEPVKPLPPPAFFGALFALVFVAAVALGVVLLRPVGLKLMNSWTAAAILGALALSVGLLILTLTRQMIPGSRYRVPPAPLPIAVLSALTLLLGALFPFYTLPHFWKSGFTCLAIGLGFAAPAGLAFFRLLHRGALMSPRLTGATAGLLAGLVGTSVLEIHCPLLEASHIVIWHMAVPVLTALAGAFIAGRRLNETESEGTRVIIAS